MIKLSLQWFFVLVFIFSIPMACLSFIVGFICRYIYGGFWKGYYQAEKDLDWYTKQ